MKKNVLTLVLAMVSLGAFSQSIDWATSTDQGLARASREGKNSFLLITAPSWCYYCQVLESDVLSDPRVIEAINSDYVPIMILDTDSDIGRFDFYGYPTVYVLDSQGNIMEDIYTLDSQRMLNNLAANAGGSSSRSSNSVEDNFDHIPNVAMYGGANWSGKLYERYNLTPEEAMSIADDDPDVDFFFFTKGGQMVLDTGVFRYGTAVFFEGEPWWGSAPALADGYVKKQSLRLSAPPQ